MRRLATAALLIVGTVLAAADNLAIQATSTDGLYRITLEPAIDPLEINRLHRWTLTLNRADGEAVEDARVEVTGGMPEHNHGLPTEPRVTEYLGAGRYRLEGMRFHMHGAWELKLEIDGAPGSDSAIVSFTL